MGRPTKFWLRCTTDTSQDGGGSGETSTDQQFTPITTQDDLNRIIQDRVRREQAKYADYAQLKAKADELDTLKAASQTEAEKSQQQVTALQQQLADMQLTTLRARIQAKHGLTDEDAELFLTATDEETLTRQAEALAARAKEQAGKGPVVPSQGNHPKQTSGDDGVRDFTRNLFGRTT